MKQNYSNLGTPLTRSMLKKTFGGADPETWSCTFTFVNGVTITLDYTAVNGNSAQCRVDTLCWEDNNCSNVDCAGSGEC